MRIRNRIRLVALLAAGALLLVASTAFARNGRVVNSEAFFSTYWAPIEIRAAEFTVRCNLTLNGSFTATTYSKTAGLTVGRVTETSLEGCTGGTSRVLTATLPWSITYTSFTGTLPRILEIQVSLTGVGLQVEPGLGVVCLLSTEARAPARGIGVTRAEVEGALEIPTIRADETARLPVTGAFCPTTATLRGSGRDLPGGEAEVMIVQLI